MIKIEKKNLTLRLGQVLQKYQNKKLDTTEHIEICRKILNRK